MKVNIKLYKTNFDEENPFVSSSKQQRALDIDSKFSEGSLLMENASFNIDTPFRIGKNFFDLDKKYNYAKYEFYNGSELKDTRFYYIRNFKYVNDNVTDMVASEDIIGEHFWDLDIKYCMPQKYTYKEEYIKDRLYNNENALSKSFKESRVFDNVAVFYDGEGNKYYVGFIVVSAITSNDETTGIYCKYTEDGVAYNINTYFIPFLFNEKGILDANFTQIVLGNIALGVDNLINIHTFQKISTISTNGFKYVSSFIFMDTKSIVSGLAPSLTTPNTYQITLKNDCIKDIKLDGFEGEVVEGTLIPSIHLLKINEFTTSLFDFEIQNNPQKTVSNYSKILFSVDGNYSGVDISMCANTSIYKNTIGFSVSQSLVPPYSVSLNFESNKTNKKHIELQRNSSFMYVDDSYTEWLKSNRNASITGMQVRQDYESFIIEKQMGSKMSSNLTRSQKGLLLSTAIGGEMGTYSKSVDMALEFMASMSDAVSAIQTVNKNHEKERALLDLQIQDLINTPDSVTMGNNVFFHFKNQKYIKITYMENVRIDEIIKMNKMFGFSTAKEINNIVSHLLFDYIRTDTIVLSFKNGFTPNEKERVSIETYLQGGIRVWYDLDYYKNFFRLNEEVQND